MHLVGFIIRIYHNARSSECKIQSGSISAVSWTMLKRESILAWKECHVLLKCFRWKECCWLTAATRPWNVYSFLISCQAYRFRYSVLFWGYLVSFFKLRFSWFTMIDFTTFNLTCAPLQRTDWMSAVKKRAKEVDIGDLDMFWELQLPSCFSNIIS